MGTGGAFLPTQDGDFILTYSPNNVSAAYLLEAKASMVHSSLASWLANAVGGQQVAAHKFWRRAGADTYFLHYSDTEKAMEVWRGESVIEARDADRGKLKKGDCVMTLPFWRKEDRLSAVREFLIYLGEKEASKIEELMHRVETAGKAN